MIELHLPLRIRSLTNQREHWSARHRRSKLEREAVHWTWKAKRDHNEELNNLVLPVTVTLIRIAPRAFDDDNIRGAFKAIRDQVATELGVEDNDPRVTWEYEQRRGGRREYAVLIQIEEVNTVAS